MATLNIRKVPEEVRSKLRIRAAKAGRSMEAEARAILAQAVREEARSQFDPAELQGFIAQLFGGKPPRLSDELIAERRREAARERRR
ncbi:MAG TPA: Arc family DNA-binding protein [Alphaproteobacteria bacterium]|nr:Arc family DNA-binding protein [Alphaproteobacteria bacterium]